MFSLPRKLLVNNFVDSSSNCFGFKNEKSSASIWLQCFVTMETMLIHLATTILNNSPIHKMEKLINYDILFLEFVLNQKN